MNELYIAIEEERICFHYISIHLNWEKIKKNTTLIVESSPK